MNFFLEKFLFRSKTCCTISVNNESATVESSSSTNQLSPVITKAKPDGDQPRTSDNDSCLSSTLSTTSSTTTTASQSSSSSSSSTANDVDKQNSNLPQTKAESTKNKPSSSDPSDRSLYACCLRCFSFKRYSQNSRSKYERETIKLLLLGLDSAGKTSVALRLSGESVDDIVPTIGFSNFEIKPPNKSIGKRFRIVLYDLGGGRRIRTIWRNYYSLVHAVVFVIDSANIERILEVKETLADVVTSDKIFGKPILIYLNKQDLFEAMDEIDVCKFTNLEELISKHQCPTKIEPITAIHRIDSISNVDGPKSNLNSGSPTTPPTVITNQHHHQRASFDNIESSFQWLLDQVVTNWPELNRRVIEDSKRQIDGENSTMNSRIQKYNLKRSEKNIVAEPETDDSRLSIQTERKLSLTENEDLGKRSIVADQTKSNLESDNLNNIYETKENVEEEIDAKNNELKWTQVEEITTEDDQVKTGDLDEPEITTIVENTTNDSVLETVELKPDKPKPAAAESATVVRPKDRRNLNALNDGRSAAAATATTKRINKNKIHPK